MKNIIKFIPLLSLLFLLNGCLIPFSSARIVPKGGTEVGTGVAGGVNESDSFYDQSIFFIRKGIGHNIDYGIDIGPLALSLDIRKKILSESPSYPSIALSGKAFGCSALFCAGFGGGISLQFHYEIFSFASNYFYAIYSGEDILGGESYTEESRIFTNTLLAEFPVTKRFSIYFLMGKYFEHRPDSNINMNSGYGGISFAFRKSL